MTNMPALKKGLRVVQKMRGRTLSPERFGAFLETLFENGYINVNGSVNPIINYMDYKAWHQIEEFENPSTHEKVVIEFIKEWTHGHISYYVKDVEVSWE